MPQGIISVPPQDTSVGIAIWRAEERFRSWLPFRSAVSQTTGYIVQLASVFANGRIPNCQKVSVRQLGKRWHMIMGKKRPFGRRRNADVLTRSPKERLCWSGAFHYASWCVLQNFLLI